MRSPDARGFYAQLGITIPARYTRNAPVRCFADPDAHTHRDRTPSCSINLDTGAWKCHGCGAKGGAYDGGLAHGLTRRRTMELLTEYGLAEFDRPAPRSVHIPVRPSTTQTEAFALDASDADVRAWADRLLDDHGLRRRLAAKRRWRLPAIRELQIGSDVSGRITIPVRAADGRLRGVLRYDPFGDRDPKMLAVRGTELGLIPHPFTVRTPHVVLVEGPPDLIAARSLGLAAIAVPGTHAWRPEWAQLLTGRNVTIVMDCDPAGRAAGQQIAADLQATATPTVLDLWPGREDGYDLTDRIRDRRDRGPLTARAVASLLIPVHTPRAEARATNHRR